MTNKQILVAARKLIERPESWTQGWFAKNASGLSTYADHDDAVCWCASGALIRVAPPGHRAPARNLLDSAAGVCIEEFNDSHSHADVLAAFDKAIEAAS